MQNEWTKENKTLGQCSITAFLAQDIFGGDVYGLKIKNVSIHCYNVVNGYIFDLTSEQFGEEAKDLVYEGNDIQYPDSAIHFQKEEKKLRYEYLKKELQNSIFNKKYRCSIENFIQNEYSISREERQYALFLYNILRKYRKSKTRKSEKIKQLFNACQIPATAEIKQVFYEVTFMRDFFERNRRIVLGKNNKEKLLQKSFSPIKYEISAKDSFNNKLIQYVCSKGEPYLGEEHNLGHNKIDCDIPEKCNNIIRYMMNVKPDIAVIYKKKGIRNLLFLECKESLYLKGEKQTEIQWKVADFLCNYYLKGQLKVSDKMKDKKSCIVQFARQEQQDKETILINDLIEINNEIFS